MSTTSKPITFRLPPPGKADPYFGFSRSYYYQLEKRKKLKLVRILDAGLRDNPRKQIDKRGRPLKQKGVTLVPFDQVAAFVSEQMEGQNGVEGDVRGG